MNDYKDAQWLKQLYVDENRSLTYIAKLCQVSPMTIRKYLNKAGVDTSTPHRPSGMKYKNVPLRTKNEKLRDREWLIEHYVTKGLSRRAIRKLLNNEVSRTAIKNALKSFEIPLRNLKEARNVRTKFGRMERKKQWTKVTGNEDIILQQYEQGVSIRTLAMNYGVSNSIIRRVLSGKGVELRPSYSYNKVKHSASTKKRMSATASKQILSGTRRSHERGVKVSMTVAGQDYRFRSMWEACYAVYLERVGLQFEYERKCFAVGDGFYIPDFYIPATDSYIEIKGYLSNIAKNKYEAFRKQYPDVRWKMLQKPDMENIVKLYKDEVHARMKKPKLLLIIGTAGSGKSHACRKLDTKRFHYISYDENKKANHLDMIRACPEDKVVVYDLNVKTSTFIRRHHHEFDIMVLGIGTDFITVKSNLKSRGGEITKFLYKRWRVMTRRFKQYASYVALNGDDLARFVNKMDADDWKTVTLNS